MRSTRHWRLWDEEIVRVAPGLGGVGCYLYSVGVVDHAMILDSITLTNFRSFTKAQTFVFPQQPGLYFMWGDNQAEPRLGRNGAGKSTLWKALTWLFFGKTSEGLKAGDAANWEAGKGTAVTLRFWQPQFGPCYTLTRTWSPNSWTLVDEHGNSHDLTKDENNPLVGWLRLEFQPFLACILMAQGQPMFLDLPAAAKAALFAEVMALDKWLDYSTKASERAKAVDTSLRSAEARVSSLRGQLDTARDADVAAHVSDWEQGRQRRLDSLEHEYKGLLTRHNDLKDRLSQRATEEDRLRLAYRDALRVSEQAQQERDGAKGAAPVLAPGYDRSKECPTCGQSISAHFAVVVDRSSNASKAAKQALELYDAASTAVRQVQRDIQSVDKALDNLEEREDQVTAEVNPYLKLQETHAATVEKAEQALASALREQDHLSSRYSILSGWVRWFKEIRLSLIGEALEQLEIEVNSCVAALGLVNWELRFDVDKETAKGTLQRGFTVSVLSPHNEKAVPWEAWSGGESQRLRLATNMGLANLIRARTGTLLNLEVWDEPTQHMGEQGVMDLLDSLKDRAQVEKRQIWIVDHNTLGYSDFDGQAGVVKTWTGSHFVQDAAYSSGHENTDAPTPARRSTMAALPRRR